MVKQISRRPDGSEPPGRRLFDAIHGRFEPLHELGVGAVFTAHLAEDKKTGREVVIKRLRTDMLTNPNARYTLETEARAISMASHPGIPKLIAHSLGIEDPFIAEEYKSGRAFSLNNLSKRFEVVKAGIYICGILSALHKSGVVHRDVKPSNLVLGFDGSSVSLIDYGFSIVRGMEDFAMRADIPVGTPTFMAPEQTYAKASVDYRVDIYSLGVILYSYISGCYPYVTRPGNGTAEEYFQAHRFQEAAVMHERNQSINPQLSFVIARALDKDPGRRYQSAEDFADALSGCLISRTVCL